MDLLHIFNKIIFKTNRSPTFSSINTWSDQLLYILHSVQADVGQQTRV